MTSGWSRVMGRRLRGMLDRRRQHRPPRAPTCPRHLTRPGVPRTAAQAARVPEADGLDRALVLLIWQRVQLRLPRYGDESVAPVEYNYRTNPNSWPWATTALAKATA